MSLRRLCRPACIAMSLLVAGSGGALAQDAPSFDLDRVDAWTVKARRGVGLDTLESLAGELRGVDGQRLLRAAELVRDSMAPHLWATDDMLSSRGLGFFASELELMRLLQETLQKGQLDPGQRESLRGAVENFLAADVEIVDREIEGLEALASAKGCDQPRARHCDDLLPKLAGSVYNLETAMEAAQVGRLEESVVWMKSGWKKADRTYRRYPASTEEALAEIERLVEVIDATGCADDSVSQPCVEAGRRLYQARRKVERAEIEASRGDWSKVKEHYENAWRIAHEAILDLPPVDDGR